MYPLNCSMLRVANLCQLIISHNFYYKNDRKKILRLRRAKFSDILSKILSYAKKSEKVEIGRYCRKVHHLLGSRPSGVYLTTAAAGRRHLSSESGMRQYALPEAIRSKTKKTAVEGGDRAGSVINPSSLGFFQVIKNEITR